MAPERRVRGSRHQRNIRNIKNPRNPRNEKTNRCNHSYHPRDPAMKGTQLPHSLMAPVKIPETPENA